MSNALKFEKYSSIENSYREKEIQKIFDNVHNETWVVLEKVHGTNLSFITNGENVRAAKRTQVLGEGDNFYNSDKVLEKYSENVKNIFWSLHKLLNLPGIGLTQIQIFGEHFGGYYNGHKSQDKMIQKEVQYIPFTDFIVYDIKLYFDNETRYLDWNKVKELCKENYIPVVPELFRGSFEDCLKYPNDYITTIPELYGLESIEGNITEGNVIKTIQDIRIGKNRERAILKNKNEKFKEKGRVKSKNKSTQITDEQRKWVDEITKYFEKNRLISGLFFKDAFEDFLKDNPNFIEEVEDKKVRKLIQNIAQSESKLFIREILKRDI